VVKGRAAEPVAACMTAAVLIGGILAKGPDAIAVGPRLLKFGGLLPISPA
jgi:hypothetical protein